MLLEIFKAGINAIVIEYLEENFPYFLALFLVQRWIMNGELNFDVNVLSNALMQLLVKINILVVLSNAEED
jgi:hypothetical protein